MKRLIGRKREFACVSMKFLSGVWKSLMTCAVSEAGGAAGMMRCAAEGGEPVPKRLSTFS